MDSHHVGIAPRIITLRSGAPPRDSWPVDRSYPRTARASGLGRISGLWMRAASTAGLARAATSERAPDLLRRLQRRRLGGEPEPRRPLEQEVEPHAARRPPDRERAEHPGGGDDQRHHADIADDAGL